MKFTKSLRSFFYAVTHAKQLITENTELMTLYKQTSATVDELRYENTELKQSLEESYFRYQTLREKYHSLQEENKELAQVGHSRMIPLERDCELTEQSQKKEEKKAFLPTNMPVGRIDYLGPNGLVRESVEYHKAVDFEAVIRQDNFCDVPMCITVYSDPVTGKHINTSWVQDLDPPPKGYSITPYQEQPEQEGVEQTVQEVDVVEYDYEP